MFRFFLLFMLLSAVCAQAQIPQPPQLPEDIISVGRAEPGRQMAPRYSEREMKERIEYFMAQIAWETSQTGSPSQFGHQRSAIFPEMKADVFMLERKLPRKMSVSLQSIDELTSGGFVLKGYIRDKGRAPVVGDIAIYTTDLY